MKRNGFTLVELVIVIAILGILAGVAIPAYADLQTEARSSQAQATLGAFRSAIGIHYAKNKGAFPSLAGLPALFSDGVLPTPLISGDSAKNINTAVAWVAGGPSADVGGWMYNATTGRVQINSDALDPSTSTAWSAY